MDNEKRADSAREVLTYFCQLVPNDDDIETLAIDLICNIKHLLARENLDHDRVFHFAQEHFDAERSMEDK